VLVDNNKDDDEKKVGFALVLIMVEAVEGATRKAAVGDEPKNRVSSIMTLKAKT
jgi:hypothetical protein